MDPHEPAPQNLHGHSLPPAAPQFRAGISDDLHVPWGWLEVALFVILGVIGSVVITWGMAQIAVRFFGVNSNEVFGETMSTAKSVVVLLSQAHARRLRDSVSLPDARWRERPRRSGRRSAGARCGPAREKFATRRCNFWRAARCWPSWFPSRADFSIRKKRCRSRSCLKARVSILLFGVLGVLVAPLVEETIFRGFLYPVIARRLGVAAGVAITGTLFGLMHAAQLWGGWGQIALLDSGGRRADVGARADRHRGGQLFCAPRLQWLAARRVSDLCRQRGASLAVVGQASACLVLTFAALTEVKRRQAEACPTGGNLPTS